MYTNEFATEISEKLGKSEGDLPKAARGVAALLLKDARNYQLFGPYWWAVKKLIKKHTILKEWFTGDYMDDMTYQRAWHGTEIKTISAAMFYQQEQIMVTPSHSVIIDGEDQSYTLYDEDAGF